MAKQKAYTLGIHGFVASHIVEALGASRHHRQATVLIVARTKAEAIRTAEDVPGVPAPVISDSEFRVAGAPYVAAIVEHAGDLPAIYVHELTPSAGAPVVRVDDAGPYRVGRLQRAASGYGYEFVAEGDH